MRWYLFLADAPKKSVGHNPLTQLAMFCFMTLGLSFMIVTGMAIYATGAGLGFMFDLAFGRVRHLVGNCQTLRTVDHLGMWRIVVFMRVRLDLGSSHLQG